MKTVKQNDPLLKWFYDNPPDNLSGKQLAYLVKQLITRELQPGGPYITNNGITDYSFNKEIAKYLSILNVNLPSLKKFHQTAKQDEVEDRSFKEHIQQLIKHLKSLPVIQTDLKNIILNKTLTITARPGGELMTAINYRFAQALEIDEKIMSPQKLIELDLANTFFWLAFIIYDDFWDQDEDANPQELPAANFMARQRWQTYWQYAQNNHIFKNIIQEIMVQADNANFWEITHCRLYTHKNGGWKLPVVWPSYENYQVKFYPTAGHILGPLSIVSFLGYDLQDSTVKQLINYFRYHLIARQINDDLHDWEEDLQRGHLSTVTLPLLKEFQKKFKFKYVNLARDKSRLTTIYWQTTVPQMARLSLKYSYLAEESLKQVSFIKNPAPLLKFNSDNKRAAQEALSAFKKYSEFIKEYKVIQKTSL